MPYNDADAFLDHIAEDEALQEEFRSATTEDQILMLLTREQVTCTPAEIRDAFLERFGSELNEDQLAAIAGGMDAATIGAAAGLGAGITIGVGIAVASSAAAAA
jgi:predicted ribosomally synthesized peptide with nif11-like leader